jgi:hypothetical protein
LAFVNTKYLSVRYIFFKITYLSVEEINLYSLLDIFHALADVYDPKGRPTRKTKMKYFTKKMKWKEP